MFWRIKNKKGIFFTMIVILIVSLLVVSYTFYSYIEERKAIQKRIETMNNFISSLEQDIPRKLFISGFRAVFTFENKIVDSGAYILNVNSAFQEIFYNGTFGNQAQPIMIGATFSDIKNDLNTNGKKININISVTNPQVLIDQIDPWNVRVTLIANFIISDDSNLASWNKTLNTSGIIPILYFDDPVYLLNTQGLIANKINKTIYTSFNSASLLNHTTSQSYINSTEAPSFLDRLQGSLSSNSPNGIESLVNIQKLEAQGLQVYQKSIVDHIYFSSADPSKCHVSGQPAWFYLDNNHLPTYQASCG